MQTHRLRCAHRRHDDRRGQRGLRPEAGGIHADRSVHGVPGAHRHHALLHEHRSPCYVPMVRIRVPATSAYCIRRISLPIGPSGPGHDFPVSLHWVMMAFGDAAHRRTPPSKRCRRVSGPASIHHARRYGAMPNSLLTVTLHLTSALPAVRLSCIICMVAYHKHRSSAHCAICLFPCSAGRTWPACLLSDRAFLGYGTRWNTAGSGIAAVWRATEGSTLFAQARPAADNARPPPHARA